MFLFSILNVPDVPGCRIPWWLVRISWIATLRRFCLPSLPSPRTPCREGLQTNKGNTNCQKFLSAYFIRNDFSFTKCTNNLNSNTSNWNNYQGYHIKVMLLSVVNHLFSVWWHVWSSRADVQPKVKIFQFHTAETSTRTLHKHLSPRWLFLYEVIIFNHMIKFKEMFSKALIHAEGLTTAVCCNVDAKKWQTSPTSDTD